MPLFREFVLNICLHRYIRFYTAADWSVHNQYIVSALAGKYVNFFRRCVCTANHLYIQLHYEGCDVWQLWHLLGACAVLCGECRGNSERKAVQTRRWVLKVHGTFFKERIFSRLIQFYLLCAWLYAAKEVSMNELCKFWQLSTEYRLSESLSCVQCSASIAFACKKQGIIEMEQTLR